MGDSRKNRIIILSILLIFIVAIGIFFLMKGNRSNSDDNGHNRDGSSQEDTNDKNIEKQNDISPDTYYYFENFIGEEEWATSEMFLRYEDNIVKIIDKEKPYLENLETQKNVYDFPNEDIFNGHAWWIDDGIFWNVQYDKKIQEVMVRSFDNKGTNKENVLLKDFKGNIIDNSYIMVEELRVAGDYIYLLSRTNTQPILQIFLKSGEHKSSYENVESFDIDNKGHCVYTTMGSETFPYRGFFMIDSENGDEIFRNTSYELSPIRFSEDKRFIYGFDKKINVFDAENGKFIKSVFEFGKDSTYLLDDYDIRDFMVGKDEEFYFSLRYKIKTEEEFEMVGVKNLYYLYTKEEGKRPARETTLTLTAPYRYDFMEEAIKRYELKYPNEHVEYLYIYNSREIFLKSSEEYGAKLTLDIISGETGDIVQIGGSGLNYENLLRTDAFMDLTDIIMTDKNYSDLNKGVLNGIKINNAIRALPISYIFNQYELNEDLEKQLGINIDFNEISWSEVLDILKIIESKAPDRHLFTENMNGSSPWEAFGVSLLNANMQDLINLETKTFDLNQEWFKNLLIKFKEHSKSKNFVLGNAEYDRNDNLHGSLLTSSLDYNYYYADRLAYFNEYNKDHKSKMIPIFTGEKNNNRTGYSKRMYSINNRSDRKENAWKFLSFLLEEDIQFLASRERTGIPVNKLGIKRMIEESIYMHPNLVGDSIDKYNKSTKDNSNKIDYLYDMGYLKLDMLEPINDFMKDEITLEEALKKAKESIIIRLNE